MTRLDELLVCRSPFEIKTLEQRKVWSKAHMLWFYEPKNGANDTGPARRHYTKAILLLLVEQDFMTDTTKMLKGNAWNR